MDDGASLGEFTHHQTGLAPYYEIIFNNHSGPLGRPVAMASFAANHASGLFSTQALKATNLLIHLCNGILIYLLLSSLFRLKNPVSNCSATMLSAIISTWWLLMPIHISTVLYIVQRMTELATFFSLSSCLFYVSGRNALQNKQEKNGIIIISISLFVLLPLAVLTKESAFSTITWLLLIELFFFNPPLIQRIGLKPILISLISATIIVGIITALKLNYHETYYKFRDFTLEERLLTQPRVICDYIRDIFIPQSSSMGVFQDDYSVSTNLFSPWTTLASLFSLCGILFIAIRMADSRWWALSFGLLLYFSGHLIESTIIPLELYFEHRNYMPSVGLLIAASSLFISTWPWKRHLLAIIFFIYLGLLSLSTLQRTHIWGNKSLLFEVSAINHPHSLRAWTDYAEDLNEQGETGKALEATKTAALNNPAFAGIFNLQEITIYCRNNQVPPQALIQRASDALRTGVGTTRSLLAPLQVGLELSLTLLKEGRCGDANLSPLAIAMIEQDNEIINVYGENRKSLWLLRLRIAQWLLNTSQPAPALVILRDTWSQSNKSEMPLVGLLLAQTLHQQNNNAETTKVLADLALVTSDAPPDFQAELHALHQKNSGPP